MLKIKEIFYSLQGEGFHAGRPTVFIRFSGCNLWSGKTKDKEKSPCYFCDTDFVGGKKYTVCELANEIKSLLPIHVNDAYIVFTGGEPSLQITDAIISELKNKLNNDGIHCSFAIETNGENDFKFVDNDVWITVSPKTNSFKLKTFSELKLLYPLSITPDTFDFFNGIKYLQPIFDISYENNIKLTIDYCLNNPSWKLSIQQHKVLGIE
jgi:7-carboxy-7-deazaguanine synthase